MTPEKETPTPKTVEEVVNKYWAKRMTLTLSRELETDINALLQSQNQAADERLREMVKDILEMAIWQFPDEEEGVIAMARQDDIKTIAAKHGITNL